MAELFGFIAHLREKQFTFRLMISFTVIMRAKLGQSPQERALAEQDHIRQAQLLGGATTTFDKHLPVGDISSPLV